MNQPSSPNAHDDLTLRVAIPQPTRHRTRSPLVMFSVVLLGAWVWVSGGPDNGTLKVTQPEPGLESDPLAGVVPDFEIPELPGPATEGLLLADHGSSGYRIVLEPGASRSERYAAREIQTYFRACTGVELPIVEGRPADDAPMLVLGRGPLAESLGVKPRLEDLGDQGYAWVTADRHLVIAGAAAAGTLYGARAFLEEDLGVRWYAPGVTRTPKLKTAYARVRTVPEVIQPSFRWRLTCYHWPGGDDAFRARRGLNDGIRGPDHELGIHYAHDGRCHTYFRYVHPRDYFDAHPEYFSEIGGRRIRDETQLCLTHPDVLEIVTGKMLARIRDRPGYEQQNFSQEDWYGYCQCADCSALNDALGTAGGTQFWFVNQLAERIAAEFPNVKIGTLAYTYTEEPPKNLVMHPNVAVWLCHMFPSCQSHPIATCEKNAEFRRRAQRWSEICNHLYIWYYIVNFAHYYSPHPNFGAMAADYRFFHELGVKGVYSQAMGHGDGGGEFSLLRGYYATQLMRDHSRDPDVVMYDFLQGYYEDAAPYIYRYAKLLQHQVDTDRIHLHLYTNPGQGHLTDAIVAAGEELFDQAEQAVAGNRELLERVRVCRMPLVYARWFPRNGYQIEDGQLRFLGDLATPDEMVAFAERMANHGFRNIREWGGTPEDLAGYSRVLNQAVPLATIRNEHLTVEIAPFMGARALRIIHHGTGECVTAHNTVPHLMFPFAGGEDTRVGGMFAVHEGGPMEPAEVISAATDAITLRLQARGFDITRRIELEPDQPVVRFFITVANPSDAPRTTRVKSHLAYALGGLGTTRVTFQDLSGTTVEMSMEPVIANLREGSMFHAETGTLPAGEWTFSGAKGVRVTQRFDIPAVDLAWVYAYPEELEVLETEIWRIEESIPPGESVTLRHELEIRPVDLAAGMMDGPVLAPTRRSR